MKGSKNSCDYCDPMGGCCMRPVGLIHAVAGIGVGFLLVEYFGLFDNLAMWGWILVGVGVVGHFLKKKY